MFSVERQTVVRREDLRIAKFGIYSLDRETNTSAREGAARGHERALGRGVEDFADAGVEVQHQGGVLALLSEDGGHGARVAQDRFVARPSQVGDPVVRVQ